eukprot:TRINITY_DN453_c0_g1_i1.p1 TRINITY_DN453_c0_g1~~TRINITY_DN453_c0_g1_i1.p1  ORF type:complete len:344 (+),score=97.28 TRINITY_DN453_c0_g1_i1:84-1034(+)
MFGFPEFYERPSRFGRRHAPRQAVNNNPFSSAFGQPTTRPVYNRNPYYQQEPQYVYPQHQYQPQHMYQPEVEENDEDDLFNLFGHRRAQTQPQQHQQYQQHQQHPQQAQETAYQAPVKRQPRKINKNKSALKIQRLWRGWNVRKYELVSKLRAIKKLDEEVEVLWADNQQFLHPSVSTQVPPDVQVTNNIPRPLLLFEHELTSKLLSTDEITGRHDTIRTNRKDLVNKIEKILAQVDSAKTFFQQNPQLTERPQPVVVAENSSVDPDLVDNSSADVEPIVEDLAGLQIDSSTKAKEIPPLKTMCYNLCDRMIKQAM